MSQPIDPSPPVAADEGGVVIVDKAGGMTSHDVVSRVRRLAGTRRVGHAGTLDPMATGVMVLGMGRGTRLLTYLSGLDKDYEATIRLGISTTTDDAAGEAIASAPPGKVVGLAQGDVGQAVEALRGQILQVPSSVSAVKVDGRRAYARVRAGEQVVLAARPVTVRLFDVLTWRPGQASDGTDVLDIDVRVSVSAGTYVRALARDLGEALGVGGHVTALRRTRVGPFVLSEAHPLEELAEHWTALTLAEAATRRFEALALTQAQARALSLGQSIPLDPAADLAAHPTAEPAAKPTENQAAHPTDQPVAAIGPDGRLVALISPDRTNTAWRPKAVFTPAAT
ncbi:MAG: tRNA pseudouridine(55) synthase TruB [Bifidobacteriaceae bacterium]|jgi:tRNA pseudouridine55 synthase|nr:tRNA pseudouridine(55) synthase TruB [Bifidobacteriaceae bacterium]